VTPFALRRPAGLGGLLAACCLLAAEPKSPDLSDYRTVDKAIPAVVSAPRPGSTGQSGYLGAAVSRDARSRLVVEEVQPDSPGDKAGVKKGDVVTHVGEHAVKSPESFREWLQTHAPGDAVKLGLLRDEKLVEVTATLAALSRPKKLNAGRVSIGIELGEAKEGEGVRVEQVVTRGAAATAGVKTGDRLIKIDGNNFTRAARLSDILAEKIRAGCRQNSRSCSQ